MQYIQPEWPAPKNVHAFTTTRQKGNSQHPYTSFNLASYVGDDPQHVESNRLLLAKSLNLPAKPCWLTQTHSNHAITIGMASHDADLIADATTTVELNTVCVVTTADCLPILICNQKGTRVAAIHAGWRGLASGIVENTLAIINEDRSTLLAWLGPAIGPAVYEVSEDVLEAFVNQRPETLGAFQPHSATKNKWLANLYLLATLRLQSLGVKSIFGGEFCTFSDQNTFYSSRRDNGLTGRMATLIWLGA